MKSVLGCLEIKISMENTTLTERTSDIRVHLLQLVREEYLERKPKSGSDVQLCMWRHWVKDSTKEESTETERTSDCPWSSWQSTECRLLLFSAAKLQLFWKQSATNDFPELVFHINSLLCPREAMKWWMEAVQMWAHAVRREGRGTRGSVFVRLCSV